MRKLFLLEDDLSLISGLTFAFKKQGFALDTARTLAEAEVLWSDRKYDLLVLDVSLPDGSGFDFCQKVRRTSNVPILFLTASDEEMNIIMGLELGGDDYLTKPFKLGVLLSRVNALLRRANASSAGEPVLESGSITVRLLQGQVYKNGILLELTGAEYKLLCFFMQHPNAVLSREQILDALWDCDGDYIDSSALTVYIRRLRMKIEDDPGKPQMLLTARGMGKIPTNMTKNFILKYASQSTGEIGGQANSFVDSTLQRVRLSFRVKDIGTKKMQEKEDKLYNIVEQYFPNDRYTVKVTGSSIIFFKGTQYLVFNLFTSLALAIVLIAFFMAWMFKSKRMVLVALIPNIIPQIITAAIMGYFGIPIKASTILVFSIAFGISVDGTIHYLAKYRQELQGTNWSIRSSAVLALQETGQSMIYNAIILFFGFGIFALSDFGGTVALGILVSITLLAAMLSNLILLPSLLLTLDKHTTNKTFQNPKILSEEENKKD